ncbi:MAG: hypothetical protein ACREEQ_00865, partial [Caulobacteraceae bacterium]
MAYETTTTVRRPMAPVDAAARVGPIIMWSGVFAGGAVAIAFDALFAVLGGAIGATEFNPYALGQGALSDLTVGEGIWLLGSNLVAFFIGGYVGARASVYPGAGHGLLQGLTVWAAALVVSVFLANIALSTGLGHAVTAGAASGAATASQNA